MKIKAGVIGLGRSGWDIHCKLLQMTKEFEIYAVSDVDEERIIKEGLLGDVFSVFAGIYNYQIRTDWQIKKEFGGGILNNRGAHIIDQVLQLVSSPARNVYCEMKKVLYVISGNGVEIFYENFSHLT